MREYKFRGKNSEGNWCYGCLIANKAGQCFIGDLTDGCNVDPATVGQFIEKKNGVEIYEGDVIKATIPKFKMYSELTIGFGPAYYRESSYCIPQGPHPAYWVRLDGLAPTVVIEIVGNIHDNPELLIQVGDPL